MKIAELITLAESKKRCLEDQKREYERIGDADGVMRCENEISEIAATLAKLRLA